MSIILAVGVLLAPAVAAEPETGLNLSLVGTVVRETGKPIAIIQVGETGEQKLYHQDDDVNGGQLTSIRHDGVTLVFAGQEFDLGLVGSSARSPSGTPDGAFLVQPRLRKGVSGFWRIDRETLTELSDMEELKHHAKPLGQQGLIVEKVSPDGLFDTLGLREGDVILNINGRIPSGAHSMIEEIRASDMDPAMLRLEIDRQGRMDAVYFEVSP